MGKYLIKSDQRLMEAASQAQLERLVLTGLVVRDALVRTLPDGPWTRAEKHPDTASYFRADEVERTMIAVMPAAVLRTEPPDESEVFWVRTDVSTVEARGLDVLKRLYELGVVRAEHGVGSSPRGPFVPLSEHPDLNALTAPTSGTHESAPASGEQDVFTSADGAVGHALRHRPGTDASVVIALSEAEIEYFQEEVSQKRAISSLHPTRRDREVSNIIVLTGAEIEFLGDDDEVGVDAPDADAVALDEDDIEIVVDHAAIVDEDDIQELSSLEEIVDDDDVEPRDTPAGRPVRREVSEVIQLSHDDIEELDQLADASWDQFCRAMNLAAERLATGPEKDHRQELTWDLFRSMMEQPGPSESSWNRFRARIDSRSASGRTPLPVETTWDRFRELMTAPEQTNETTWNRFVRNIHKGRTGHPAHRRGRDAATAARQAGSQLIAGEARIKSDVFRVVENAGPNVRVEGSLDKHRRARIERLRERNRREDGGSET